jgi:DNA-binding NtrC family response regulator
MLGLKERRSVYRSDIDLNILSEPGFYGNIRSILIVDDDRSVLDQLSKSFAICAKQYYIYTARNGTEALEVLKTSKVDILLTIPDVTAMHDFDLVNYARLYHPSMRVFVMSNDDSPALNENTDYMKIDGFIQKPLRIEMIYSTLRV